MEFVPKRNARKCSQISREQAKVDGHWRRQEKTLTKVFHLCLQLALSSAAHQFGVRRRRLCLSRAVPRGGLDNSTRRAELPSPAGQTNPSFRPKRHHTATKASTSTMSAATHHTQSYPSRPLATTPKTARMTGKSEPIQNMVRPLTLRLRPPAPGSAFFATARTAPS